MCDIIPYMGLLSSFVALLCWGLGDFLIQRSARKFGDWIALFYITAFASVALLPFVYKELGPLLLNQKGLLILLLASAVITFAAYFDFEALRIGKISIVEPIYAFEVPVTAMLAASIIGERLSTVQVVLIMMIMMGIFLVSARSLHHFKNIRWEKGIFLAVIATAAMGTANFLFGLGARETNPLLINWFTSLFASIVCLVFLASRGELNLIASDFKRHKRLILGVGFIDNLAWVAFCYGTLYIPIAIVTSISESYIALAAFLGLVFNKEKLLSHQKLGFLLTVSAAVALAAITKG